MDVMVSYGQNAEDAILRRAFEGQPKGFYVDAGAAYPRIANTTAHFYYVMGWRGVNVEPDPTMFDLLQRERPGDVNLRCCAGTQPGETTLTIYPGAWGWATTDKEVVEGYEGSGYSSEKVMVPVRRLDDILEEHVPRNTQIDFFKADVEGSERAVLESANLERWRPRVVVVEATEPNSTRPSHHRWEDLILKAGYRLVLFDGLNRFYVRLDEPEIAERLSYPACVFDSFIPEQYWWAMGSERRRQYIDDNLRRGQGAANLGALEVYESMAASLGEEHQHAAEHQR